MVKERIAYIDTAKAVAILLVILGHGIQYFNIDTYQDNLLFNLIYAFHMPLFMLMSGLFFEHTLKKSFVEMLANKCSTLLFPSFIWTLPAVLFFLISNKLYLISGGVIYGVWFLKSVFLCYVMSYVAYKLIPFRYASVLLQILALCLPLSFLPGNINSMLPFFVAGIVVNRIKDELIGWKFLPFGSCAIFLLLFYLWEFDDNKYDGAVTLAEGVVSFDFHSFCIYLYRFAIGLSGSLCTISLCSKYNHYSEHTIWLGRHTLEVYVFNGLVSTIISHLSIHVTSFWLCDMLALLFTVVQVYVLSFIIKWISSVSWLRLILFGKRTQ